MTWGYDVLLIERDTGRPMCQVGGCTKPATQHVRYVQDDRVRTTKDLCPVHGPGVSRRYGGRAA